MARRVGHDRQVGGGQWRGGVEKILELDGNIV